jgi:hypothetical protein
MLRNFALGLLALLLMGPASFGALMLSGMNDGRYEAHSTQFQGESFFVDAERPDGTWAFRGSGIRVNEWYGLTAAHLFLNGSQSFSNARIGTGSNYLTDRGEVRSIVSFGLHPSWTGVFDGTAIDLAWVKFDQPLSGNDLVIGNLIEDELVTVSGYGRPGTPSEGMLPVDGERRAFDAPASHFGGPSYSTDYASLTFAEGLGFPINGKGLPGDSGSGGFNSLGDLVSITAAGTEGTATSGHTLAVRLDQFAPWIAANTTVPEPSLLSMVMVLGYLVVSRKPRTVCRGHLHSDRHYPSGRP